MAVKMIKALQKMNEDVMKAFGMNYSASHTEFIKCHEDGQFYFWKLPVELEDISLKWFTLPAESNCGRNGPRLKIMQLMALVMCHQKK